MRNNAIERNKLNECAENPKRKQLIKCYSMKKNLITLLILMMSYHFGFSQSVSGIFNSDFNELTITQNGNSVTGTYKYRSGRIEGTLSGRTLTGFWVQDNGKGKIIFEFNSDFSEFTGKWGYNDAIPSSKWNGKRIGGTVGGQITPVIEEAKINGVFSSDFNELTINQNGNSVTGTYKHRNGRIEGTLSSRTLTGWWYQDNGKGKMIFEFNSDLSGFTGKWGNNDALPSDKWNGTKIGGSQLSSGEQQNTQQNPQASVPKSTSEAPAAKSSKQNTGLNNAEVSANDLPQKNKIQVNETQNAIENEATAANIKRRPLNATETSLVENAKRDLGKAITDEGITDSERTKMVVKSAKTLKEYGQPSAFPDGDIPLKTNREKEYKRIEAEVTYANNLRVLLSDALLSEQLSMINALQIEVVEEQITLLIPGKAPFDLSKDLVGTVFGINFTEGVSGGKVQDAKDLVQKFRDLATTKELVKDVEKLYLLQQGKMKKAYQDIAKAETIQNQLRKDFQDAYNSVFTFKEFTPSGVLTGTRTSGAATGDNANTGNQGEGKGLWVLVETINYDGKADIDNTNKRGVYQVSGSISPGSYNYDWKYLGKTDTYYDPPVLNGESYSIKCTVSNPPKVMEAGELITLNLSLAFTAQNLSYFTGNATASADFDKWDTEPGFSSGANKSFVNSAGKSSFKIDTYKTVKVYSVKEVVTAKAPAGVRDIRIALRTIFFPGAIMGTSYIYEWKYAH